MLVNGSKKGKSVAKHYISNRDINLSACRLLLLSVIIRHSIEYGSEVREGNEGQTNAFRVCCIGGRQKKSLGALLKL